MSSPEAALVALFGDQVARVNAYHHSLATVGVQRGLIGPREVPRLWDRHILNSALISRLPPTVLPSGARVCDVGSGAGLPGIPLALARSDLKITLLEPLHRRVDYLEETIAALSLRNIEVVRGRAEEGSSVASLRPFDVVTSRAVAPLERLLRWCLPLCRSGGYVAAMKGQSIHAEIAALSAQVKGRVSDLYVVACAHPEVPETATVLLARRRS